ncbi:MAG: tetratricopeptide repeat protein [Flavobacteriaceae bacterium]
MKANFLWVFVISAMGLAQSSSVADSLYAVGHYAAAINAYASIGTSKAQLQVARSYRAQGHYEKAIVTYGHLIKADPHLEIAKFELGKLYLLKEDFHEALLLFQALREKGWQNPEYHYYTALSLQETGNGDEAVTVYQTGIAQDSTHLRSLFQLGKHYVAKRERDSALLFLNRGLYEYDGDVKLINLKALALYNNAEYAACIPLFEKLRELGYQRPHVQEKLAYARFRDWDFHGAKEAYRELAEYRDNTLKANAYMGLSSVYYKEQQLDSAEHYAHEFIKVSTPNLVREYGTLASIARKRGHMEKARTYYQNAQEHDPDNLMWGYQICTITDQMEVGLETKLACYESFVKRFGDTKTGYMVQVAQERISRLKEEIHFTKD